MIDSLNATLMDRTRLVVMVTLAAAKAPVGFTQLLNELKLTKGNLSTHLRRLEDEELIDVTKVFVDRKPLTTYTCSAKGLREIEAHLRAIEALLKKAI